MKSPLSFLTGLVRRRPVGTQPLLIGEDKDSQPQPVPAAAEPPLPSAEPARVHDENIVEEPISTAATEVKTTADISSPVDEALRPPVSDTDSVQASAPAEVKQRTKRRPKAVIQQVETVTVVEQASVPAPTVTDEVINLDSEISELRKQLTQKLQLQNAQLKKMLERFGS